MSNNQLKLNFFSMLHLDVTMTLVYDLVYYKTESETFIINAI